MADTKNEDAFHDLHALLSAQERDFLILNNGQKVKVSEVLKKKVLGLYFSCSLGGPCRRFTRKLVVAYEELSPQGDFEVVFISSDRDDESFNGYFAKMPWTAIPFSDSKAIKRLKELFKVRGIPYLVILDEKCKVLTDQGVLIISDHGAEGYPFSAQRLSLLKREEEAAKKQQTLRSILVSSTRDFLISKNGRQVPISELEGKIVGLYFCLSFHGACLEFTTKLVEMYKKLKEKGENFEIVLIPLDDEEEQFKQIFETMPWLALPFKDKLCQKLIGYFELRALPILVVVGPDGKTLHYNVSELIQEHGVEAYPFSPEKLIELAEIEKERLKAQTLESLLVSGEKNFVITKAGSKVPISELVGKNVVLYFSARCLRPCAFLPQLISAYHHIKAKDDTFEVIFISNDHDQASFNCFFATMPWLALPFGDERKAFLQRRFKVGGIPAAIAIGPNGQTVTTSARKLIETHGPRAYPFTKEHIKQLEEKIEEMAKGWPENLKLEQLHAEHELVRTRRNKYICDGCNEMGCGWSFYCEECDFDLHPKCALKNLVDEEADKGWMGL